MNNQTKINNSNIFLTQCENIIEEYNYLNLNEEIDFFIENECKIDNNKYFLWNTLKFILDKKR